MLRPGLLPREPVSRPVPRGFLAVICVAASLYAAACGGSESVDETPATSDSGTDAMPDVLPGEDAANVPDASVPDVVVDAKPDVIPPPPHYCAGLVPKPKFCDDFDDGNLTNDWTASAATEGSVFELDTSTSTSAPASFHVVAQADMAAASNNVLLRTTLFPVPGATVNHGKLVFSALLPSVTFTQGAIALASFHITTTDAYTLYLRGPDAAGNVPTLEENVNGTITEHMLTALPPINAWTRVTVDLDLAGGKASVSFDTVKALDAATITVITGSEATVRIGAIIDSPSDKLEAHYDDVIVDF
jgi:hypothetical protein